VLRCARFQRLATHLRCRLRGNAALRGKGSAKELRSAR
jgi:hypothetical protein